MKEHIFTLAALIVIFVALSIAFSYIKERFAKNDPEKQKAIDKAKEICEKLLAQVTLALFTEAERKFGDGTGKLKMSYVLERFLALLPDWVQELIDPDWLAAKLEALLLVAKDEWQKNTKLLGERINDSVEESTID